MLRKRLTLIITFSLLVIGVFLITQPNKSNVKANKYAQDDHSFILNSKNGQITNDTFKGKAVVLFFGYMNCPDICPTALTDINNAMKDLTSDEKKNTQVVFVSVDPKRDTVGLLDEYVKYFNDSFIGATSSVKYLRKLTRKFYADFSYHEDKNSAAGYSVAHTGRIYILNKQGKLVNTLGSNQVIISDITKAIKEVL